MFFLHLLIKRKTNIFFVLFFCFLSPFSAATYYDYGWTYDRDLITSYINKNKFVLIADITPIYKRGLKYKKFINYVSKKYDVPREVFAIPAIESGYRTSAKSQASAVGMWQIIKSTALSIGLRVDNEVDERRDWRRSTVAAVRYIKHLAFTYFNGDYELAILSYNAGVGNVKMSIKRMGVKNAWYLIKNDNQLHLENKEYLIKFIIYSYYFGYIEKKQRVIL